MTETLHYKTAVLFGGTGFIGTHLAASLLKSSTVEEVFLADLVSTPTNLWPKELQEFNTQGKVHFVELDVRKPIQHSDLPQNVDLIVNLAAVHKQPGHKEQEYFETNLAGAENVCAWATQVKCNKMIFTSSIATFGKATEPKTEDSLPTPNTPYGISKLVAEKIHLTWQAGDPSRRLLIVRPGVIFGHNENGNVTRMIKAVLGRYFFYTGNKKVRKAGGYVKELCNSMMWMLRHQNIKAQPVLLYNFSMDPAPTVEDYVHAINKTVNRSNFTPNVPHTLLLTASYFIEALARVLKIKQPISPVRMKKLVHQNLIVPTVLKDSGYTYQYTLDSAMADWKQEWPEDWSKK